jgi:hypothetical protein
MPTRHDAASPDLLSEASRYRDVAQYSVQSELPPQHTSKNRHSQNHALQKDSNHNQIISSQKLAIPQESTLEQPQDTHLEAPVPSHLQREESNYRLAR